MITFMVGVFAGIAVGIGFREMFRNGADRERRYVESKGSESALIRLRVVRTEAANN